MDLFLISAIVFGISFIYLLYQQIYEIIFYRNRGLNFDIDNKFTGTTFDGDSNDPMFVQSNRKRVIFGMPMLTCGTLIVSVGAIYAYLSEHGYI